MNRNAVEFVLAWIVGSVFAVAAGIVVWLLYGTYVGHYAARSWVAVPAKAVGFEVRATAAGTGVTGGARRERLATHYRYAVDGVEYHGWRVDFSVGSDNFSGERRARQATQLRAGDIVVYVDPADPAASVFDRSLPAEQVVFALIFLLFPCGLGTAMAFGLLTAGLARAGWAGAPRYLLPLLGIFHGAPALYPILFAPQSLGPFGWLVSLLFAALCAAGVRSLVRRLRDPSLGTPDWSLLRRR